MTTPIGFDGFAAMLVGAAEVIRSHHEELSRLDSCGGDGDHGSTMVRAMAQVEKSVAGAAGKDLAGLLQDVGWAIMGVDGGATGPLFGSLFMGMAGAAGSEAIGDSAALAVLFDAGLAGVRRRTKAQPGDKTMLDALVPAVEALGRAGALGLSLDEALEAAAAAALEGAKATRAMQARFGRAKNLGEKSIGEPDPGATSVAYLFEGLAKGVKGHA
ncbi:MAG TPA: dihydroxyacetone kinase subunit DhaL [Candidatus Hydrogenedentes bacterium]|nr:dihydroxyacetone kinase subunit DhaL [Candidatus Hydrogenedentota bacterium]HPG68771.1 dihydroxyacetone kinase subunit DhaL [Candidatus Hydrogenedentota bacterium]